MYKFQLGEVLGYFYPTSPFVLNGEDYSAIDWQDEVIEKPTEAHIDELMEDYENVLARRSLYPEIGEQLDWLWHGMKENPELRIEPFFTNIARIKLSLPVLINRPTVNETTFEHDLGV